MPEFTRTTRSMTRKASEKRNEQFHDVQLEISNTCSAERNIHVRFDSNDSLNEASRKRPVIQLIS